LADSYAALTDARPFRPAMTAEAARKLIVERAGIEFDPEVVAAFLSLGDFEELKSYAKTEEPPETKPDDDDWTLFSLFMR
jgi:HD-GYP domain-containing protein (c-di-GMP phosphodiesterase class II)